MKLLKDSKKTKQKELTEGRCQTKFRKFDSYIFLLICPCQSLSLSFFYYLYFLISDLVRLISSNGIFLILSKSSILLPKINSNIS